jgi:hypothetical protein
MSVDVPATGVNGLIELFIARRAQPFLDAHELGGHLDSCWKRASDPWRARDAGSS